MLGVKDNQPGLAEAIRLWFASANAGTLDRPFWDDTQVDKDHGRLETRHCVVTNDVAWLKEQGQHWTGLQSLVMVESTRDLLHGNGTRTCSTERRSYTSSLPAKAALLGNTVRAHWGIENRLHWVLDAAAQNFAILRRVALNLLEGDTKTELGIANKRLKAGWDVSYLSRLLGL